jgi:hypothetical protein
MANRYLEKIATALEKQASAAVFPLVARAMGGAARGAARAGRTIEGTATRVGTSMVPVTQPRQSLLSRIAKNPFARGAAVGAAGFAAGRMSKDDSRPQQVSY